MTDQKDYTLLVFKRDGRAKTGELKIGQYEYCNQSLKWMQEEVASLHLRLYPQDKYRIELHETFVERKNALTGETFIERFDTPFHCSPRSESYFAN